MLTRRRFLCAVSAGLFVGPVVADAQPKRRVYRIGVLSTTVVHGSTAATQIWDAFAHSLQELGYVEGENFVVERRSAPEGRPDQLRRAADELVRLKVDVIVASGGLTPYAAKSATTTLPVVFTNHGDPVGGGLVASLAHPGGNITGLSLLGPELLGKQLELLKTTFPRIVRIAVLWNPTSRTHPRMLKETEAQARALALRLEPQPAGGLDDYERAFAAMTQAHAEALLVLGDPISWQHRSRIVELAAKRRLPGMFAQREYVEAGGLMSYGANLRDNFRRAAIYVDKILKGAKPADLPVEQPTKFELVINLKTAKALGLTIPPSLLLRADQVIE